MKKTVMERKSWVVIQALFLYTWLVNLKNTDSFYSVYLLCAAAGALCLCDNARNQTSLSRGNRILVYILAGMFAIATTLANYPLFEPVTALLNTANVCCCLIGGFIIGYHVLVCVIRRFPLDAAGMRAEGKHACLFYIACFGFLAAVYLAYLFSTGYPVYLAHDSLVSMEQVKTGIYSNNHPYWYTRFIGLCLHLGYWLFSDVNAACATYSTVQSVLLAACLSYSVVTLYQAKMPLWTVGVTVFLYGFLPYNLTYSITMWKDTLFGGCSVVVITALYRILQGIGKSSKANYIAFLIGGMGFCLVRNNGLPVFLAWTVLMVLFLGKRHKKLLVVALFIIVFAWAMTGPVLELLEVADGEIVEILAVPFQQIARVIATGGTVSEPDMEILEKIFSIEQVKIKYSPEIVDPIKFESMQPKGQAYLLEHMGQFLSLWLRVGLQNPGAYLKAWVELTKGFWNGGYYFWIYIRTTWYDTTGIGGFEMQNIGRRLFDALFRYTEKPTVFEPLYSIGLQVWIILCCGFACLAQKRKQWLIAVPMVINAVGLWFITPVYAEFRYAYPFFVTCPVILFTTLFQGDSKEEQTGSALEETT